MLPKYHLLLGFIFSVALSLIFPSIGLIEASIIFLSSFLIDVDHYIYYLFKNKKFNPLISIKYFILKRKKLINMNTKKRNEIYSCFCFLHGIEVLVILFIMGIFVSKYFFLIFIGFTFHILLDILEEIHYQSRLDKISLIYTFIRFKKLKYFK
jgi:hypothetical protein